MRSYLYGPLDPRLKTGVCARIFITEVGLRIDDSQSRLLRFARVIGTSLDVETVLPADDGSLRLFFTVADVAPETVRSAAEESVSVRTVRCISQREREALFEAVVSIESSIPKTMAAFDGSVTRIRATPEAVDLVVAVPQTADVREFVGRFEEAHPSTDVTSVQRVAEPLQTHSAFYSEVEERLTERQFDALRLAYHSGYFEWPRDSTASDVADSLGVAQPTFSGHLRAGHRKLLELLFDR
jgi:hypothetical protein